MDWWRTLLWVFRGRAWILAGFIGLVAWVYAHVPLTPADLDGPALRVSQAAPR